MVKMFDFLFASNFKIRMKKKKSLLKAWECNYKNDGYEEIFTFNKDNYILKFADDLREHSVLFTIFYNHHKVFEAGYKEIILESDNFKSNVLKDSIKQAKTDVDEVEEYFKFLNYNNMI